VILAVEDLQRAVAFYRQAFEWREIVSTATYAELAIDDGMRIGLYERVAFGRNTGQVPIAAVAGELSRTELYLHVDSLPDTIASLERAGARCLSAARRREWGDEAAYFADTDGNVIVVAKPAA
jgi:predicted enzyme related to lactoylglutathione lyase